MWLRGGLPRADRGDLLGVTTAEPRLAGPPPGRRGGTGERPGSPPFPRPELVLRALLRRGYAQGGRAERYWGVLGMGGRTHRATWAPHAAREVRGLQREGRGRGLAGVPAATGPYSPVEERLEAPYRGGCRRWRWNPSDSGLP